MGKKTNLIQTLVDDETKEKLDKKVEAEGDNESNYVRRLIVKDVNKED
jgi:hypothetical protein